tara:strand:- start:17494 stop:17652 length:159 start_codon:yes stop_codon:yes gene_type:complete
VVLWDQDGSNRSVRGGSWDGDASYCTVSLQIYIGPGNTDIYFGFRLARSTGN